MNTLTHKELKEKILLLDGVSFISLKTITVQNDLNKGGSKGTPKMAETLSLESLTMTKEQLDEVENLTLIDPDNIKKHTYITGILSTGDVSYSDFVNNRLTKESKANQDPEVIKVVNGEPMPRFEAMERKWGTALSPALVEHKGQFYLTLFCLSANKAKSVHYYEGKEVNLKDAKFDPWRKPEKIEGERQGTEKPVVVRDYKFESIQEITMGGETFKVIE
jgi:hypothetical protein